MAKIKLKLLPPGVLQPNHPHEDPLKYYYLPFIGALYRQRIENGLSMLQPPYSSVLEVGYGSGVLLPTLCEIGKTVDGVDLTSDPERTTALLLKQGVRVNLFKGDISTFRINKRYDLIVAFSIFEHLSDPSSALKNIAGLLNANGILLIGMPRVSWFMTKLFLLIGFKGIERFHVTTYTKVLSCAQQYFTISEIRHFPFWVLRACGLYFNIVLKKR